MKYVNPSLLRAAGAAAFCTMMAMPAHAVPKLQLDIVGGTYDNATQTIVTTSNSFRLLAIATPGGNLPLSEILSETFYISAAVEPKATQNPAFFTGSFDINGVTFTASDGGLNYGTPPLDATGSSLPDHGMYPTYYAEIAFTFDSAHRTTTYNTQDDAGGALFAPGTTGGSYYFEFEIDVSGLELGSTLHFDLYDEKVKKGEVYLDHFAPFSHDAESRLTNNEVPLPEPASAFLLGLGMLGAGWLRRRRARNGAAA